MKTNIKNIYIWVYLYEYIVIYISFIYFAQTRSGTTKVLKCWLAVAYLCLKNKANVYKLAKYQTYVSLLYWHSLELGYKEEMKIEEEVVSETES